MPATLTVRDESTSGKTLNEFVLDFLTERITVRELIRSRVYQEVQDYNVRRGQVFNGLVQPEEAEKTLNGWKLKQPRLLDWKKQFERAVEDQSVGAVLVRGRHVRQAVAVEVEDGE